MIVLPDIQQQAKRLLFQEKVCFLLPSAMIIMCLIYYSGIQLWTCSFTKQRLWQMPPSLTSKK